MRRKKKTNLLLFFVSILIAFPFLNGSAQSNRSPADPVCRCPVFTVTSDLEQVKAGAVVEFKIQSLDAAIPGRSFRWEVSEGTIVTGQGTSSIKVETGTTPPQTRPTPQNTPPSGGFILRHGRRRPLRATARLVENLDCKCREASETVTIGSRSVPRNLPAHLTDLDINPESLVLPCRPGTQPGPGVVPSASMVVNVLSSAQDPEHDVMSYHYTVSGGRVVGSGRRVKWDLDGVVPGSYTITAAADDGCGICGQTQTRTLTVTECEAACSFCECPTISIAAPEALNPGGEHVFVANVSGGTQRSVTYRWAVENGEILNGQGTPGATIRVWSDGGVPASSVSVAIGGVDPACACVVDSVKTYIKGRLQ